jgi:CheY-like chemotaxis protein
MPGMQGADLLRAAREVSPDTSRILFSGHIDIELIRSAVNAGEVYRFITKPWNDDELLLAVRNGVERWQLLTGNRLLREQAEDQNRQLKRFNGELEAMVANRTEALALRNQALTLSQEILDRLPVAVIGMDHAGRLALANLMAQRILPGLAIGEPVALSDQGLAGWIAAAVREHGEIAPYTCTAPVGELLFSALCLDGRGLVITAVPADPIAQADLALP